MKGPFAAARTPSRVGSEVIVPRVGSSSDDGSWSWIRVASAPMLDAHGQVSFACPL
jgi:hypothetical protein